MAKRKPIEPAEPVSRDPHLRALETAKRREIARLKESDMEAGRQESLSVTTIASKLDARLVRGDKAADADRKRTDAAHGTRAQREARWLRVANTYAALKREHPDWPEKKLDAETAKRCAVSTRTVQTHKKPQAS